MSLIMEAPDGGVRIWGSAFANTSQLRRAASNAVRLRLPSQLDFRLDSVLDPDGFHIVNLRALIEDEYPERVANCHVLTKFAGTTAPFEMDLTFRLRDYVAFEVAGTPTFGDASSDGTPSQMFRGSITRGDLMSDELTPDFAYETQAAAVLGREFKP